MAEQENFENLFEAALSELNRTAEQPTEEVATEEQTETAEVEVVEATETEAVGETEAGEAEVDSAADSDGNSDKGPIAVTEADVIVLPDGTEVSVKEAVLRQADYTRKTQALAEERRVLEADKATATSAVEYVENLTKAWQSNQAEVVSGFVASTEDPTLVLSQVIVELAKAEKLDPKFLETFGITPETQEKWSAESKSQSELQSVKARLERFETEKAAAEAAQSARAQEDNLIAEYEDQWAQIKATSGLALDPNAEVEVKIELLQYALNNDIPNLKAAWKALQYEKSIAKPAANPKKVAVDAKKAATGAISPKSSGSSITSPKAPSNIEDAVLQAFQELTSKS